MASGQEHSLVLEARFSVSFLLWTVCDSYRPGEKQKQKQKPSSERQ